MNKVFEGMYVTRTGKEVKSVKKKKKRMKKECKKVVERLAETEEKRRSGKQANWPSFCTPNNRGNMHNTQHNTTQQ
jgi:hypothetical protein